MLKGLAGVEDKTVGRINVRSLRDCLEELMADLHEAEDEPQGNADVGEELRAAIQADLDSVGVAVQVSEERLNGLARPGAAGPVEYHPQTTCDGCNNGHGAHHRMACALRHVRRGLVLPGPVRRRAPP